MKIHFPRRAGNSRGGSGAGAGGLQPLLSGLRVERGGPGDSLRFRLRCRLSSQPGLIQGVSLVWFVATLAGFGVTEESTGHREILVKSFILG